MTSCQNDKAPKHFCTKLKKNVRNFHRKSFCKHHFVFIFTISYTFLRTKIFCFFKTHCLNAKLDHLLGSNIHSLTWNKDPTKNVKSILQFVKFKMNLEFASIKKLYKKIEKVTVSTSEFAKFSSEKLKKNSFDEVKI